MSELRKAAQDLVDRWDTPLWKDAPHTGTFIDALRAALAQPEPLMEEVERLQRALRYEENRFSRIGTHGPDCWKWGPHQHYECALRHIAELSK